jgi:hypothetical protein
MKKCLCVCVGGGGGGMMCVGAGGKRVPYPMSMFNVRGIISANRAMQPLLISKYPVCRSP